MLAPSSIHPVANHDGGIQNSSCIIHDSSKSIQRAYDQYIANYQRIIILERPFSSSAGLRFSWDSVGCPGSKFLLLDKEEGMSYASRRVQKHLAVHIPKLLCPEKAP